MADVMKFDLVSPERALLSGEAKSVQIPGTDGDMTALPDHAPTLTTLRPGRLSVEMTDGTKDFAVTGGFAEVTPEGTTVLAERAYPATAENRAAIEAHLEEARTAAATAEGDGKDLAEKAVADIETLLSNMV